MHRDCSTPSSIALMSGAAPLGRGRLESSVKMDTVEIGHLQQRLPGSLDDHATVDARVAAEACEARRASVTSGLWLRDRVVESIDSRNN